MATNNFLDMEKSQKIQHHAHQSILPSTANHLRQQNKIG